MKITLVRHGQTEYNYQNRLQGTSNIPLNDTGRRQCYKLKEKMKNEKFDICFSSPLVRAVETAMILVGDKVQIINDNRLKEREIGNLEGKEKSLYDKNKYWDYYLNCNNEGVEPIQDIFIRCNDFLNYIFENYKKKSILIVSHGAITRAIHHILHNTDLKSDLINFDIDNGYNETIIIKDK